MAGLRISTKQVALRWRHALRQTGGPKIQLVTAQVRQDLLNHDRIFDASNDFHAATANSTRFDVNGEHSLQTKNCLI